MSQNNETTNEPDTRRRKNFYLDLISAIAVTYLFGGFLWTQITPEGPKGRLSIFVIIGIIDLVPAILGIYWLILRYGDVLPNRFPMMRSKWFIAAVFLVVIFGPTLIKRAIGR